jgi:hypothetical protein
MPDLLCGPTSSVRLRYLSPRRRERPSSVRRTAQAGRAALRQDPFSQHRDMLDRLSGDHCVPPQVVHHAGVGQANALAHLSGLAVGWLRWLAVGQLRFWRDRSPTHVTKPRGAHPSRSNRSSRRRRPSRSHADLEAAGRRPTPLTTVPARARRSRPSRCGRHRLTASTREPSGTWNLSHGVCAARASRGPPAHHLRHLDIDLLAARSPSRRLYPSATGPSPLSGSEPAGSNARHVAPPRRPCAR